MRCSVSPTYLITSTIRRIFSRECSSRSSKTISIINEAASVHTTGLSTGRGYYILRVRLNRRQFGVSRKAKMASLLAPARPVQVIVRRVEVSQGNDRLAAREESPKCDRDTDGVVVGHFDGHARGTTLGVEDEVWCRHRGAERRRRYCWDLLTIDI